MLSKVFPRKYRIFELQEVNSRNPCKTHVIQSDSAPVSVSLSLGSSNVHTWIISENWVKVSSFRKGKLLRRGCGASLTDGRYAEAGGEIKGKIRTLPAMPQSPSRQPQQHRILQFFR
jgi:hypothetical protein